MWFEDESLKHMSKTICTFKDYGIYNLISDTENEANLFVAEYLLDTDETLRTLEETNSFFQTAALLIVPLEILDYKRRMLSYYKLLSGQSPIQVNSDCMKRIQVSKMLTSQEFYSLLHVLISYCPS